MTNRTLARLILAAALGFMLAFSWAAFTRANEYMDSLINQYRLANGRPALVTSPTLTALADQRAREIVTAYEHNYWWIDQSGCTQGWGENLMFRVPAADDPVLHAFNAFLASGPHDANMLGDFTHVGTAVYIGPDGGQYVVQLFGKGCGSLVTSPTETAPEQPTNPSTPVPVQNPPVGQAPQPAVVSPPVQLPDTSMEKPND